MEKQNVSEKAYEFIQNLTLAEALSVKFSPIQIGIATVGGWFELSLRRTGDECPDDARKSSKKFRRAAVKK